MNVFQFDPSRTRPICQRFAINKSVFNSMILFRNIELNVTKKLTHLRNDKTNIRTYGNAFAPSCCTYLDDPDIDSDRALIEILNDYIDNVK